MTLFLPEDPPCLLSPKLEVTGPLCLHFHAKHEPLDMDTDMDSDANYSSTLVIAKQVCSFCSLNITTVTILRKYFRS